MSRPTNSHAASSRSSASSDRLSPSSKRSPRTQSTKDGGGVWPRERAKTSRTASGDRAWVEWVASRLASICAEDERRRGVLAGVEEERQVRAFEIERVLDLKLKILDRRDVLEAHARDPVEQHRPKAVVAARVVAPAENDEAHLESFAEGSTLAAVHGSRL